MKIHLFYFLSFISLSVFADKLPGNFSKNLLEEEKSTNFFIENAGQITDQFSKSRPDVLFKFEQRNLQLFFKQNGFSYQIRDVRNTHSRTKNKTDLLQGIEKSTEVHFARIDVDFLNSNSSAKILPGKINDYYENYIQESEPHEIYNVKTFNEIYYKSLYSGIDLVYYLKNNALKYDFLVAQELIIN